MANELGTIGNQLQVGDGASPEVFTIIGGTQGVPSVGGGSGEQIDITSMEDLQRVYLKGYKTPPNLTVTVNIRKGDTEQAQLEADDASASKVVRNYRVTEPNGTDVIMSFAAYVNNFTVSSPAGDAVRGEVEFILEGRPTFDCLA